LIRGLISLFFAERIYEPVNLGNPNPTNIINLANEIIETTKSSSEINFLPLPQDDPRQRNPDISRARLLLGWEPQIQRAEGVEKTIEYFRKRIGANHD
jgi:nucleoside-diphosphate-sugar epimerase